MSFKETMMRRGVCKTPRRRCVRSVSLRAVEVAGFKRDTNKGREWMLWVLKGIRMQKGLCQTPEKALGLGCFKEGGGSCGLIKG